MFIEITKPILVNDASAKVVIFPFIFQQEETYLIMGSENPLNMLVAGKATYSAMAISGILFIIGLLLIQKFSNKETQPIKKLMSGTEEVIRGNFEYQIKIDRGPYNDGQLRFVTHYWVTAEGVARTLEAFRNILTTI